MDALLVHVLGEDSLGVSRWLLEPEQESVPELNVGKRRKTHKEEHAVEDGKRKELEHIERQDTKSDQQVGKEHGQASLLDRDESAILILVSQSIQMDNTGDSGSDQPGKTQDSIDAVEESVEHEIVVVGFSVLQLVTLVVDQVPGDTVIKEAKQESKNGGESSKDDHPSLSVEVAKVRNPVSSSGRFRHIFAIIGPEGVAGRVTALESGLKFAGNLQSFSLDRFKDKFLDQCPDDNREGNSKVVDRGSDTVVAEEGRVLEATEEENQPSGSESENSGKQSSGKVAVLWIIFELFVRGMARGKETEDTGIREGITDGIHDENTDNQKGKDLIGETSGKADHTSQVEEGGEKAISKKPDTRPCVHGQERDIHVVGNVVEGSGQGQDRTSRSDDTLCMIRA